jgi:signal peptidase I
MKQWLKNNRGFLVFLVCFGFFRTAIADWNPIPSGSMRPTILEGDVVWVDRLAYDLKIPLTDLSVAKLGSPRRGDIVTFKSPKDGTRLIKRLVALPGDVVEMRDEVLFINGRAAEYIDIALVSEPVGHGFDLEAARATERVAGSSRTVQFLPRVAARKSFGPVTVPREHYFMLGDNRDNSEDSRFIGFVPRASLIGRAERILVSADITGSWLPRLERTVAPLR